MRIIKRISKDKKYIAKNGKEYSSVDYYLELDNGVWVSIKPVFSEGFKRLDTIAYTVVNGK